MNDQQKYERHLEATRARVAKYDAKPENILKKKLKYEATQRAKILARIPAVVVPPVVVVPDIVVPVVVPDIPSVNNLFNLDNTFKFIQQNVINKNTRDKQAGALKAMFRVTGIHNIGSTLTTFNSIKNGVESGLQLNGTPYAIGTKVLQVSVVLYLIDKMEIPMTDVVMKKYTDLYQELKIQEQDISRAKKTDPTQAVVPYTTYMELIEKQFGKDSKQFLIASMYNEVIARDNFGSLVIIPNLKSAVIKSQNYIIMPSNIESPMRIILQKYKTVGNSGGITFTLTQHLSNLLRYYILNHKLTDKLFPEVKNGLLSAFVSSMNDKIKVEGGINYIRHSKVSEFLATNPTPEQRRIFSERTFHSPDTQLDYNRILIE